MILRTTVAGLLLAAAPIAMAEVYRWVDEDGVVNYSQLKPEGQKGERATAVDTRASRLPRSAETETSSEAEADGPKLTEAQQKMLDDLKAKEAEREAQVAEIRADNCDKSRAVLDRLTRSNRIRVRADGGGERVMAEDERQRRIDEAQRGIATNCDQS